MKKLLSVLFLSSFLSTISSVQAQYQKDAILLTVGEESVTLGEFLDSYQKNNSLKNSTTADLEEYLELYTNFLLKVKEGRNMLIDTVRAFVMELEAYKNQSAQQYLVDKDVSDKLVNEAIERTKYNIRASHILIECSSNATPKDTLAAYIKAIDIRNRIKKGEYTFADAAVKFSEDKSVRDMVDPGSGKKQYGNKGDLGYFSSFNLIYPFETGAYNTPVGEISMPVRSQFGYHLIYVVDRIPGVALINVAQIFIADELGVEGKMSPATEEKLKMIEANLKLGVSFEQLVREYSEDEASKEKDGVLQAFGPSRRSGDFVKTALDLKPGEVSKPTASSLGWHVLKMIEIQPVVLDDERAYLVKTRVGRDSRSHLSKSSLADKLKKEYGYKERETEKFLQFLADNVPSTFFQSGGVDLNAINGIEKFDILATYSDQKIKAKEYLDFLKRFQGTGFTGNSIDFFRERYTVFFENAILAYERTQLERKYPEYRALVKEYHEGMILYEINSKMVWNKAIQDSVGIINFYEKIKTNYPVKDSNPTKYKPLDEIRAIVITEYQDQLDKEWVSELRKKYNVTVNRGVFNSILKK
ncbi:MAG: peptidylprolyl isomerase [Bacteroidales bacterium]|jgi:peptidyl-prolyl cis-trans isomerase SurA|nr:peptidylprolyl isomerase [Bacteroidales bacterium]